MNNFTYIRPTTLRNAAHRTLTVYEDDRAAGRATGQGVVSDLDAVYSGETSARRVSALS